MGRHAKITYEQVKAAAEAIRARSLTPGVRNIRVELGEGSNTTIGEFFDRWEREEKLHTERHPIPTDLRNAIFAFVDKTVEESHERLLAELAECRQRIDDLAVENKRHDELSVDQSTQIERLLSQNAMHEGIQTQLRNDLSNIGEELGATRQSAEQARIDLAVAQARMRSFDLMEGGLRKARSDIAAQRQARTRAEHERALLAATKADVEHRLAVANDALALMEQNVRELANRLNEEQERRTSGERELAVLIAGHRQIALADANHPLDQDSGAG